VILFASSFFPSHPFYFFFFPFFTFQKIIPSILETNLWNVKSKAVEPEKSGAKRTSTQKKTLCSRYQINSGLYNRPIPKLKSRANWKPYNLTSWHSPTWKFHYTVHILLMELSSATCLKLTWCRVQRECQ